MAIKEPDRIWWNPYSKDERLWTGLALIWMVITFLFMPVWHLVGSQNPPSETYRVTADQYGALVDGMVQKYQVMDENGQPKMEQGFPVVHPDPSEPVYLKASMWQWYPVLELEQGKTYRVHLSSMDLVHGLSIQPININFTALPGYDYVIKLTPTTSGEFYIMCNEFCGVGHHTMVGKLYVK
ncbi:MAG: cytochrome C oxidase subunit II [Deltaproteobacteria bacterium]|nr:cytochrome C oxidase subunit II [Deltaproteobacteria bacterium]